MTKIIMCIGEISSGKIEVIKVSNINTINENQVVRYTRIAATMDTGKMAYENIYSSLIDSLVEDFKLYDGTFGQVMHYIWMHIGIKMHLAVFFNSDKK